MHGTNWVFGYGSLLWRPGFAFIERVEARLLGAHRRLCVYSHVHRGTPDRPGLVLGLDRGGSCIGSAFRVHPSEWDATVDYLRAREQVTNVYVEKVKPVILSSGERVRALTYTVDRSHIQYAGALPVDRQIAFIQQGHGQSGPNIDYVRNTLSHLESVGIADHSLAAVLEAYEASISA